MNRIIIQLYPILFCFLISPQQPLDAFLVTRTSSSSSSSSSDRRFVVSLDAAARGNVPDLTRRQTCQRILLSHCIVAATSTAAKVNNAVIATTAPLILASRVQNNVQTPPAYGMEGADVHYPSWFEGKWNVQSACTAIEAPCGIPLFGGNRTYANARQELNDPPLGYEARFLRCSDDPIVVADREFNVRSIAQAVMGPQSVLDIPLATPNKLTCILLLPTGAPSPLQVDLIALQRKQETPGANQFDCSEVVREIIAGSMRSTTVLKEIETISLYSYDPETQQIQCRQRSAKFLLPSQQDPTALRMWQMTGGRPVDVRYYTVSYTRVA